MKKIGSFFITDKRNVRHEIFTVDIKHFDKYKTAEKISIDDNIFNKHGLNSYRLSDGTVLVEEGSKYALYPSVDVLLAMLENYSGPTSREILFDRNPYGKEFPKHADHLISTLFKEFNLQEYGVEKMQILSRLDQIIIQNRNADFFENHFLSIIALIGKYNIEEFKGQWKMIQSKDQTTWTPCIEFDNHKVFFADYVLEDFFNQEIEKPATAVFETVRDIIRVNVLPSWRKNS